MHQQRIDRHHQCTFLDDRSGFPNCRPAAKVDTEVNRRVGRLTKDHNPHALLLTPRQPL
jgi:hypothetical protein